MSTISPTGNGPAKMKPAAPSNEEIRQRAYEIFCARGRTSGDAERDWLEAEQELQRKMNPVKAGPTMKTGPQASPARPKDAALVSASSATKPQAERGNQKAHVKKDR